MQIERIELDFVELPLKAPFQTSFGTELQKSTWIVTVLADGIRGYAESVADSEPLYSEETHASVFFAIKNHILPRLWGHDLGTPQDFQALVSPVRGNPMAKAAIEMALWDWFARSRNMPLWQLLGGDPQKQVIPVGVSIGIQESPDILVQVADKFLAEGYRRLKVKIKPGSDWLPLSRLRSHLGPDVPIMADANASYRLSDAGSLQQLDTLHLMMIEQPLAHDDIVDHAALARILATPICLDEAIRSDRDARKALALGACRLINIKPGRMGGHFTAQRVHDVAQQANIPVWCGGMEETGIGRAHNLHMSTLPNFLLPGDTSASSRYFAEDLIDPPFFLNPDGTLTVPAGIGIGVVPDVKRMAKLRTYHEELTPGPAASGSPSGHPVTF